MMAPKHLVVELAQYASEGLNAEMGLPPYYDQTKGNRCDRLTLGVMSALTRQNYSVHRELHMDDEENWHYILRHDSSEPTDADMVSSLNPWQGRAYGGGILHAPRNEVIDMLRAEGMSESFVALHSLETIVKRHDESMNPFTK